MKRILTIILIVLLVPTFAFAGLAFEKSTDTLYVNGQSIQADLYKVADTNYIPLRKAVEALGLNVGYDNGKISIENKVDTDKLKEACVMVYVSKDGKDIGQGSGVLIGYDQILTCNHVVKPGDKYRVIYKDGSTADCSLVKTNIDTDAAILKPQKTNVKPVKLGDADEVKKGDKVYLISSPMQNFNVVTEGITDYVINEYWTIKGKSSPGSSGGAVFNSTSELIGIAVAGNNDSYDIIPINMVRKGLVN